MSWKENRLHVAISSLQMNIQAVSSPDWIAKALRANFFIWNLYVHLARIVESVHTCLMRTNVNLADDARQFAEVYAHANGITLGDAITVLIRKSSEIATGASETPKFGRTASGFPTFPPKGLIITTEMVLKAQQEEDFV